MLIVLSGPSSSGKTSLARALQWLASKPFLHIEADRFWPVMPLDHPLARDGDFQALVVLGVHKAIVALCEPGLDLIADGSLPNDPVLRNEALNILRSAPDTRVVAVTSAIDVLRDRERSRTERRVSGWAEQQLTFVFDGVDFDAVIYTSGRTPEQCARELLVALGLG